MSGDRIDPTGSTIIAFQLLGEEFDISGRVVGVDVELHTETGSRYFVNILTKGKFAVETREALLDSFDQLSSDHLDEIFDDETERRDPYVLNDEIIDADLLKATLLGRIITTDLANSLFFLHHEDDEAS